MSKSSRLVIFFWLFAATLNPFSFTTHAVAQDGKDPAAPKDELPGINSGTVSALKFRGIGPALMSGRVLDIAVDPVQTSTWFLATVGGVWKTENAGTTWRPNF